MINLVKLLRVGLIELKRKHSWTSERAYKEKWLCAGEKRKVQEKAKKRRDEIRIGYLI